MILSSIAAHACGAAAALDNKAIGHENKFPLTSYNARLNTCNSRLLFPMVGAISHLVLARKEINRRTLHCQRGVTLLKVLDDLAANNAARRHSGCSLGPQRDMWLGFLARPNNIESYADYETSGIEFAAVNMGSPEAIDGSFGQFYD